MGRELTHAEIESLLAPYALDAVDHDEAAAVSEHLARCPSCRAEVDSYREVAGFLTAPSPSPPAGPWAGIVASLQEAPPPLALAPRRKGRRGGWAAAAALAAVAASVIAVLGVKVVEDGRRLDQMARAAHGEQLQRAISAALVAPDHREADLRSADGALAVKVVMLPDGTGYLVSSNLPRLAPGRTYQLWAMEPEGPVSAGVLGPSVRQSPFKASAPELWGLAISDEPSGGVSKPSRDPLVVGRLRPVSS